MGWRPQIFVSYANVDVKWLKLLDPHIKGLERHASVVRFDDRQLVGGSDWDAEIKAALERADIVVLLVTANFIASEYIHRVELPAMLRRLQTDGCVIIPVLFETCARQLLGVEDRGYLPKDAEGAIVPINKWRKTHLDVALTQVTEHVLAQIERRRAAAAQDQRRAGATGIDLALYRRRAFDKWSAIDLASLAAPGAVDADVTIRLGDVFAPQFARQSRPPISVPRDYLRSQGIDPDAEDARTQELAAAWERLTPAPALDLVAAPEGRRLVLLGDPGAGKSALARFILLQLLGETLADGSPLLPLRGHVPFLVELRDFVGREAEGRCADLLSYLAFCGAELGFGFDGAGLAQQLSEGPSLLIVDGLDEIFEPKRRRLMVDQIIGLAGRFPQCRVLVTSRVAGFDDHPFRAAEFGVATLVDLTPEQVEHFARDWFALVFRDDAAGAGRARDDLLETLQRRPQLRAIAGNPMILTIMVTVARHRRLGRSRAALYAQALELLCYNWDYKRGLGLPEDSPLRDLQADDTLLMLRRIGWRMQDAPGGLRANAIDEPSLRSELDRFFQEEWRFPPPRARRAASEMLDRLQERNWVLTLRGPGLYGFVHRTFLEYLCAVEITERFKAQALGIDALIADHVLPRLEDDSWREVLFLLAASLPAAAAERMLLAIAPNDDQLPSRAGSLVLAFQALAELEGRHIALLGELCGRLTELLYVWVAGTRRVTGRYVALGEALSTIDRVAWPSPHPPSIPWPSWLPGAEGWVLPLIANLGRTIWNCPDAAFGFVFDVHGRSVGAARADALAALGQVFGDRWATKALVLQCCAHDRDPVCRRGALTTLAWTYADSSRTLSLLRQRALDDPAAECRSAALALLTDYVAGDAQVRTLLCRRAVDDDAPDCRVAALRSLRRLSADPEIALLLRSRATDDFASECREIALELVGDCRDDPTTPEVLRRAAAGDPAANCRRSATRALARSYADDERTWPLLRRLAVEDPASICRQELLKLLSDARYNDPLTQALLQQRASADDSPKCRTSAIYLLSSSLNGPHDAETRAVLRQRATEDGDAHCRAAALLQLALAVGEPHGLLLASTDLDGSPPGVDPLEPVTDRRVRQAAAKLGRSEPEIRDVYERLADEIPLTLAWRRRPSGALRTR